MHIICHISLSSFPPVIPTPPLSPSNFMSFYCTLKNKPPESTQWHLYVRGCRANQWCIGSFWEVISLKKINHHSCMRVHCTALSGRYCTITDIPWLLQVFLSPLSRWFFWALLRRKSDMGITFRVKTLHSLLRSTGWSVVSLYLVPSTEGQEHTTNFDDGWQIYWSSCTF